MGDIFKNVIVGLPLNEVLFPVTSSESVEDFNSSTTDLGLGPIRPCRYGYRHGGVSEDRRGSAARLSTSNCDWGHTADSILKRYARGTALLAEVNKLPATTIVYSECIRANLQALFLRTQNVQATPLFSGTLPAGPQTPATQAGVIDSLAAARLKKA